MKVFLTGGTGYIGRSVVRALLRAGHEVTGIARDPRKGQAGARWVPGDIKAPAAWAAEARGADALLHLAFDYSGNPVDADKATTEALLAAAKEGKRTVVYTSGVWVLGKVSDRAVDETASTDKAFPMVAWRPGHERLVLGAPVTGVVVRPGIVYGGKGGLFAGFFADAAKGASYVGDGSNRWPPVHVDDLADLYVRIVELAPSRLAGKPAGERIFHGVDGTAEPVKAVAQAAARAAGGKEPASFPLEAARAKMGPFADALALDQLVAATRAESVLGWRPRFRGFVRNAAEMFGEFQKG